MLHVSVFLSKIVHYRPFKNKIEEMNSTVSTFALEGTIVATLTPMKPNNDVDYDVIEPYADYLSNVGVSGIFVNGSLGEGLSLTVEERKATAQKWKEVSKGRIKHVIIHVGAANLHDSIELAKHAQHIGADAIASLCSLYHKPQTIDELVAYTSKIAAAAPRLPFYYYDIDFMTGVSLDAVEFLKKAKDRITTLRGIKYTTAKLNVAYLCSQLYSGRFQIAVGTMEQCLPYLSVGLGVTITDTTYAALQVRLKQAYLKKDMEKVHTLQHQTLIYSQVLNKYGAAVPAVKEITRVLSGVNMGSCRLPMSPLSYQRKEQLLEELRELGYFDWHRNK